MDILSKIKDTAELIDFVKELNMEKISEVGLKEKIKRKLGLGKPQVLYVKFSYLQEAGMQKIGEEKISFKEVLNELLPSIRSTAAEAKAAG